MVVESPDDDLFCADIVTLLCIAHKRVDTLTTSMTDYVKARSSGDVGAATGKNMVVACHRIMRRKDGITDSIIFDKNCRLQ